jgi:hypothetical protein
MLFACDPGLKISGHIAGGSTTVFLDCPNARVTIPRDAMVDRDGQFIFEGVGCLPKTCRVRGGQASVDIGTACVHTTRGCSSETCTEAKVELDAR